MEFRNFLLAALRPEDAAALIPRLKEVTLSNGKVLFEKGDTVDALYFPSSACISVVAELRDGKTVEIATVGRESAAGLLDVLTERPSANRAFVQIAGAAFSLPAADFRERLRESPALMRLVLLHVRANARQAETAVACNVTHTADSRLARWLLMTQDRIGAAAFPLTQDYMAVMTGVQRSTVSLMAAGLKKAGIIDYSRGHVTIVDRPRLVAHACECYETVHSQFESLRVDD
ncbi:MAG: Crp/Fnr family transcriptional regulator [Alphaproteobacteria bacterium]|nr:Crp/Fnr family transcriptional regulator [Alphaproteobacteria bacterium]MBU1515982.1 Crp/Fnr family transcriptional regulator [Alphaproteobacteria bacterium]MBU2092803.1 Crp/Fnr family transcriptional regulator [Alphaproteobacteria bacterium]MBU2153672.1 Crp/Fnr family transcriptional regulator [Alphaproteobacteria bacterium]MBU2308300.1 Crp/Fnr family transcriptional regulator [Alphaproteobacteria bacterium]